MTGEGNPDDKIKSRNFNDYAEFFLQLPAGAQVKLGAFLTSQQRDRLAAVSESRERDRDRLIMRAALQMQHTYQHFMRELDIEDRAAYQALAEIDRELLANRRQRAELLEKAFRLPDGRRVFMTEDGTAVYDEHGNKLADDEVAKLPKAQLQGRPHWEQWTANRDTDGRLEQERQEIVRYKQEGRELRDRAESGELSPDELADIERQRRETMPERMRPYADRLRAKTPEPTTHSASTLSGEERAGLDVRSGTSAATAYLGKAGFEGTAPAKTPFNLAAIGIIPSDQQNPRPAATPNLPSGGPGLA